MTFARSDLVIAGSSSYVTREVTVAPRALDAWSISLQSKHVRARGRSGVRRGIAAIAAIALAAAACAQGWSYVWCAPMQEARLSCCCPTSHDRDAIRSACCDDRSVPALASAELSGPTSSADAAPLALVLPLSALFGPPPVARELATRPLLAEARAGPAQRVHARHSVFLL